MKNFLSLSILTLTIFLNQNGFAQSKKITIGIMPFTYDSKVVDPQYAFSINESVTNSFTKTKRFNVVDRTKFNITKQEKQIQKSEDFILSNNIKQGSALGADYLIVGHIINASAEKMTSQNGQGGETITYKARLTISIKIIDVSTEKIMSSETIEPKSGSTMMGMIGMGSDDPNSCIAKAIKNIETKIDEYVSVNFPIVFVIAEIQKKGSNGAASEVLINGGSDFGLKKGMKLKVVEEVIQDVNGKQIKRKKEIGELKITKVEDENFSICDVSIGGEEISKKVEEKAKVTVITK